MRPNILFVFSDQQRADTCSCYGQPLPITPHLDALAREGVLFEHAFSPQPVCGPCRSIFQTGLYPTQTGCFRNGIMLPQDVKTLAHYMEEAGYETAYIGKWHLASDDWLGIDHTTTAIPPAYRGGYTGFWRASDVLEFTSHGYDGYVFDETMRRVDFTGYRADCVTDFALEFLEQRSPDKPFFMMVSHIEPHHQNDRGHYEGPKGSKEKYEDFILPGDLAALGGDARAEYPDYLGACAAVDHNLGRLVKRLKEHGIWENTVVIYTSDHGAHFKTRNLDENRCGGDDYKRSCHDASLRVPLVIAGGAFTGGLWVRDLVSTASLPKTMLALAGVDVGENMIGENLLDVVQKKNPNRRNEIFAQISESRVGRCIRTPRYTYAVHAPGIHGFARADAEIYADDFLYDMQADPHQLKNVVHDPAYREIKTDLRARLLEMIDEAEGKRPVIRD
ncbi:MAG: sulfatase-like hydrolase/transferase [Christensenellales bacterium]|jgi:arylsulfatase A-like enzyme